MLKTWGHIATFNWLPWCCSDAKCSEIPSALHMHEAPSALSEELPCNQSACGSHDQLPWQGLLMEMHIHVSFICCAGRHGLKLTALCNPVKHGNKEAKSGSPTWLVKNKSQAVWKLPWISWWIHCYWDVPSHRPFSWTVPVVCSQTLYGFKTIFKCYKLSNTNKTGVGIWKLTDLREQSSSDTHLQIPDLFSDEKTSGFLLCSHILQMCSLCSHFLYLWMHFVEPRTFNLCCIFTVVSPALSLRMSLVTSNSSMCPLWSMSAESNCSCNHVRQVKDQNLLLEITGYRSKYMYQALTCHREGIYAMPNMTQTSIADIEGLKSIMSGFDYF